MCYLRKANMVKKKSSFKKTIKEAAFKSVFTLFPREFVLGKLFNLEEILRYVSNSGIIFKLATTPREHEAAAKLTYEAYLAQGMMPPNHLKKRISKYNLSPGTFTIIAVKKGQTQKDDEVIATVSLINDSNLGLPSDNVADLSSNRKGNVIAEVGSLCVKQGYRKSRGKILLPLMKYLKMLADQLNIDTLICTVHPQAASFYEVLFNGQKLPQKRASYICGTNELPACVISIKCDYKELKRMLQDPKTPLLRRQVIEYYSTISDEPYYIVEDFDLKVREHSSFDRDYARVLFDEYLELGGELIEEDYRTLTSMLRDMSVCNDEVYKARVREHRVLTSFTTTMNTESLGHITCKTMDSSFSGMRLTVEQVFSDTEIELFITYGARKSLYLRGRVMWRKEYTVGVKIEGGDVELWQSVIEKALGIEEAPAKKQVLEEKKAA